MIPWYQIFWFYNEICTPPWSPSFSALMISHEPPTKISLSDRNESFEFFCVLPLHLHPHFYLFIFFFSEGFRVFLLKRNMHQYFRLSSGPLLLLLLLFLMGTFSFPWFMIHFPMNHEPLPTVIIFISLIFHVWLIVLSAESSDFSHMCFGSQDPFICGRKFSSLLQEWFTFMLRISY